MAQSSHGNTVFLVSLGSTGPGRDHMPWGTVVGIDQIVWDLFTNTLHVESDALLAQHTRFALLVTRGVRDDRGIPIEASERFRRFRANVREEGAILAARQPSLLNAPGITVFGGLTLPSSPFNFDENFPLRDQIPLVVELADGATRVVQSPVANSVVGAMAIQETGLDRYEWVSQAGSPVPLRRTFARRRSRACLPSEFFT